MVRDISEDGWLGGWTAELGRSYQIQACADQQEDQDRQNGQLLGSTCTSRAKPVAPSTLGSGHYCSIDLNCIIMEINAVYTEVKVDGWVSPNENTNCGLT